MECDEAVPRKLKILHLLPTNRFSGAENVACQIAHMLSGDGHEVAYASPDGQIREALAERGIPFLGLHRFSVREVRNIIKQFCPDVIHAHDVTASLVAAASERRVRIIAHIHVNSPAMRRVSTKSLAFAASIPRYHHIIWVANSALQQFRFRSIAERKSSILVNVVNPSALERFAAMDSSTNTSELCFIGRLTHQKDPERLIAVMCAIHEVRPQTRIIVIGTGDLATATQKLAADLGVAHMVDFVGFNANPLGILKRAKLLVLTSRFEGTPMVALESLSLGVPIVSTPTDGMVELLSGDTAGVLCGTVESMAEAILTLLDDADAHRQYSEGARQLGARLNDIERYHVRLKALYEG